MRVVKTFAMINQKGGVGKTTTVVNLGAAVAARGHRVCLMDLDPQSHLTLHFDVEPAENAPTTYDVLTGHAPLGDAVVTLNDHLSVVPAEVDLAATELELAATPGREQILRNHLETHPLDVEYLLIDCPPSLGLLTLNALAAADTVLIPLQPHFLALQGLGRLLETISLVQHRINDRLRVGGVILCLYEKTTRLAGEVVTDLKSFFESARGTDCPWADARIFQTVIRRNIKLAECPSYGQTIFQYEPVSHGAEDYLALADEFLAWLGAAARPQPPAESPAAGEPASSQAPAPFQPHSDPSR